MSAFKLILALICLGVSVSLSMEQRTDFNNVHLQGKADHDVNDRDLKTLIQQQSAVIQKQSAAIQTLEAKVETLQSQEIHPLVKRSDDVNDFDLQALVQQQAAMIQQQAAAIQTLQNRVTSLEARESQTDTKVTALDNQMSRVQTQVSKQVAFSTSFSRDTHAINIAGSTPIKFDNVITNIGQAYNQHTGFFTAPSSGLYVFFLAIRSSNQHDWVRAGIVKSATLTVLARMAVESSNSTRFDKGSCLATTHLNQGDNVHVQWLDGFATYLDRGYETSFSGVLISADL